MGRKLAIAFILILIASSLTLIQQTLATFKPSVPEFTVQYISNSYYVPPTTSTDPYTGKTTTQGGYYSSGSPEIQIKIKNPDDPQVFFSVRAKGHYSQNWMVIEYWLAAAGSGYNPPTPYRHQDQSSEYTVLRWGGEGGGVSIPSSGQMDFQVEALIGNITTGGDSDHSALYNMYYPTYSFSGETSDWSSIVTVTIGNEDIVASQPINQPAQTQSAESTQTNTKAPTQPEVTTGLAWKDIVIVAALSVIAALAAALVLTRRKKI